MMPPIRHKNGVAKHNLKHACSGGAAACSACSRGSVEGVDQGEPGSARSESSQNEVDRCSGLSHEGKSRDGRAELDHAGSRPHATACSLD